MGFYWLRSQIHFHCLLKRIRQQHLTLSSTLHKFSSISKRLCITTTGADPGFFLGGGALVYCSTSTPINDIVFFWQNTSCIRKPQVISGGGGGRTPCTLPLAPPLNYVGTGSNQSPVVFCLMRLVIGWDE